MIRSVDVYDEYYMSNKEENENKERLLVVYIVFLIIYLRLMFI